MNKIMLYIGLAILLGTVTMVVPLALLGPSDPITDTEGTLTVPEYTVRNSEMEEPDNQDKAYEDSKMLGNGDFSAQTKTPEPTLSVPVEPSEPAVAPEEPELVVKTTENAPDLSPIGFMTIPSFLVALGVFVYLRKRML
jgi:hypothetical protein